VDTGERRHSSWYRLTQVVEKWLLTSSRLVLKYELNIRNFIGILFESLLAIPFHIVMSRKSQSAEHD